MIIAVTGHPGAGKSFWLTNKAYKAIKKGRKVFTNTKIKGCYKIEFDDLVNYSFPEGSLVIIDEAGRWFNSRKWQDLPDQVFDLFTLHRHFHLDLIVGVQNFARIDKSLREVIELTYWAENNWWLPYFVYYAYYDVDKVGGLKHYDFMLRVWKKSRSRRLYDTYEMKSLVNHEQIPLVPWTDEIPPLTLYHDIKRLFTKSPNT